VHLRKQVGAGQVQSVTLVGSLLILQRHTSNSQSA